MRFLTTATIVLANQELIPAGVRVSLGPVDAVTWFSDPALNDTILSPNTQLPPTCLPIDTDATTAYLLAFGPNSLPPDGAYYIDIGVVWRDPRVVGSALPPGPPDEARPPPPPPPRPEPPDANSGARLDAALAPRTWSVPN